MNPIDVAALVDQYVDLDLFDGKEFRSEEYPALYSFDADGEKWLTDRYWLLPESACDVDAKKFDMTSLAAAPKGASEFVHVIRTAELTDADSMFAANFAGVLTCAGLTARKPVGDFPSKAMHVLIDSDGHRIGGIMPVRNPDGFSLPIPAEAAVVAEAQRIVACGLVRGWQAWGIAAWLSNDLATAGGQR